MQRSQKQLKRGPNNNRRKPRRQTSNRDFSAKQRTCRASGRELAYTVTEADGTSGLLVSNTGVMSPTDSGARYTMLLPASIGTRCDQLSRLYQQWKINSLTVIYRNRNLPTADINSASNPPPIAAGTQKTGVMGFVLDPTSGILTQNELVEAGGRFFNLGRNSAVTLRSTNWLYCEPRATDTLSDARFVSPGNFHLMAEANGLTANFNTYGFLEIHWDISFRFPLDSDVEALRTTPLYGLQLLQHIQQHHKNTDEKKQEEDTIIVPGSDQPNVRVQSSAPRLKVAISQTTISNKK